MAGCGRPALSGLCRGDPPRAPRRCRPSTAGICGTARPRRGEDRGHLHVMFD